jgi:hypothetical protein
MTRGPRRSFGHAANPDARTRHAGVGNGKPSGAAASDRRARGDAEEHRDGRRDDRRPRTGPASDPRASRRLSPLEYILLAVIAIAVMITIVMAIVDPSG